ncbi:YncE family protein [Sutcliffiella sp. NPDC057660]|uniref:YncE family protein n=1 Tax=Sutcliffiella sp. NPDC057660 TaxID=3346199 RepID=UPI00367AA1C5
MKNVFLLVGIMLVALVAGCSRFDIELPEIDSPESTIYVTHLKENAITALDITNGSQKKTNLPFRFSSIVEIEPGYLLASVKEEEQLFEINIKDGKITPFVDIEQGVIELVYDLENRLIYAANGKSNRISVIDMEEKKAVKEIEVGEYPSKMFLDGDRLYVLTSGSGEVYVLDTATYEVTGSFSVNARPEGLHFDGTYIWTGGHGGAGEMNGKVFAYDPETGKEMKSVNTGLMPIHILQNSPDSPLFVLSHGDHSLTKINAETYKVEEKIEVCDNPSYMIADKQSLYISCLDGDELLMVNQDKVNIMNRYKISNGPFLLFKGGDEE